MLAPRWLSGVGALVAVCVSSLTASADDTDFDRGISALEAGELAEAEASLRRAHELDPSDRVQLNLADALLQQGRAVEALELLRPLATRSHDLLLQDAARDLAHEARRVVATIRVRVDPDARLVVDGVPRNPRRRLVLDPGRHRVVVHHDDHVQTRDLRLTAGSNQSISFAAPYFAAPVSHTRRRRVIGGVAAIVVSGLLVGIAVAARRDSAGVRGDFPPVYLRGTP